MYLYVCIYMRQQGCWSGKSRLQGCRGKKELETETVGLWRVDTVMSCLQNKAPIGKGLPSSPFQRRLLPGHRGVCVSQRGWLSRSPRWLQGLECLPAPCFALPTSYLLPLLELPTAPHHCQPSGHISKGMSG